MGRHLVWNGVVVAVLAHQLFGWPPASEQAGAGVYLRSAAGHVPLEAEGLTWRLGSFSTSGATTKARLTARVGGPRSAFELTLPAEFLIVVPGASSLPTLELLRADAEKDRREFDVEFVWHGSAAAWNGTKKARIDIGPGEPAKEGVKVRIAALGPGEYGFLLPSSTGEQVPAGRVYTFRNSPAGTSEASATAGTATALPDAPGVYIETAKGCVPVSSEQFEWFPYSSLESFRAIARRIPGAVEDPRTREYEKFVKCQRMNGTLPSSRATPALSTGDRIGIVVAEGAAIADYRLVKIDGKDDVRQLRLDALFVNGDTYLGFGRMSLSPGPEPILYEASKVAPRKYRITLPMLKPGNYGLLAPGIAALGKTGVVHSFEVR